MQGNTWRGGGERWILLSRSSLGKGVASGFKICRILSTITSYFMCTVVEIMKLSDIDFKQDSSMKVIEKQLTWFRRESYVHGTTKWHYYYMYLFFLVTHPFHHFGCSAFISSCLFWEFNSGFSLTSFYFV